MKTTIVFFALTVTTALSAPVWAQTPDEQPTAQAKKVDLERRVDALLSGIERTATAAEWTSLGDEVVPVLIAKMNDSETKIIVRGRAATALQNFKTPAASAALRAVLTADSPSLLLRKSMTSLAAIEGAKAVDAIAPMLEHRSKRVREKAIDTLGAMRHADAKTVLSARLKGESSEYLKRRLTEELARPALQAKAQPVQNTATIEESR